MSIKISFKKDIAEPSEKRVWEAKFIQGVTEIDILKVERLIHDDIIINDQTKWQFLAELRDSMDYLKEQQIEKLTLKEEICTLCHSGCKVHFFKANKPCSGIGIYFKYSNDELVDIIICNGSTGTFADEGRRSMYRMYNRFDLL